MTLQMYDRCSSRGNSGFQLERGRERLREGKSGRMVERERERDRGRMLRQREGEIERKRWREKGI